MLEIKRKEDHESERIGLNFIVSYFGAVILRFLNLHIVQL